MSEAAAPATRRRGARVPTGAPLALVGPTASGKTEAGVELAGRLGAEVLVIDSMTVYRGMEIGTAKPGPREREAVTHHLLDLADPSEPFSVAGFQALAREVLSSLKARGVQALLVGGSGLYFRAVVDGLEFPGTDPGVRRRLEAEGSVLGAASLHRRLQAFDPTAAARIEPPNLRRTVRALEVAAITGRPFSSFSSDWDRYPDGRVHAAGVELPSQVLRRRIEQRVHHMLRQGFIGEVRRLLHEGFGPFLTSSQAIGYLEVSLHLQGRLTAEEMVEAMVRRTRNLARRQMAWFRRDRRIRWFAAGEGGALELADGIEEYLRG